nr:hypothetical protein DM860_014115 [Ipomoea batatas]
MIELPLSVHVEDDGFLTGGFDNRPEARLNPQAQTPSSCQRRRVVVSTIHCDADHKLLGGPAARRTQHYWLESRPINLNFVSDEGEVRGFTNNTRYKPIKKAAHYEKKKPIIKPNCKLEPNTSMAGREDPLQQERHDEEDIENQSLEGVEAGVVAQARVADDAQVEGEEGGGDGGGLRGVGWGSDLGEFCYNPSSFRGVEGKRLQGIRFTIVSNGGELIRRRIGGQPLLHREKLLVARLVDSGDGNLHVVTVPAVVRPGAVRSEVHITDPTRQARAARTENVQVTPLEIVISRAHKPSPSLEIIDPDTIAISVV